jgi:ribonuclease HII
MGNKKFDQDLVPASPDLSFEIALWESGVEKVAGVDEAGRGALAGPVAAAALILPANPEWCQILWGVRDSKQMTPAKRDYWAHRLKSVANGYGIGFASHQEIDTLGIVPATRLAVQRALDELLELPQHLLLDYLNLPDVLIPQTSLVKGDARSLAIAAASILAKTARDAWMRQVDHQFPDYGFAQHKGYGTLAHRRALAQFGPSPIHRRTFKFKA